MSTDPKPGPGIKAHKMPEKSFFYDKFVPILGIALGLFTLLLILFALGVLFNLIVWK